jgi:drug/metabolite transporter (DMT)-like permease
VTILIAILLAGTASSLYALSTSLQALEARREPTSDSLRASLLKKLVRRPLWLAGAAAGVVAWPLQAIALSLASVAIVQPALGLGLIVLLVLGVRVLHERVGRREIGGAVMIAAAIAVIGWAAPAHTPAFPRAGEIGVVVLLALAAAAPYGLRVLGSRGGLATSISAGFGWAAVGLATALIDAAIADRHWLAAVAWGIGVAAASWSSLLAEMTALQTWPATRSIPVVFGIEMVLPAALLPLLTHTSPAHAVAFGVALAVACAGAAVLGSSRAVARAAAPLTGP